MRRRIGIESYSASSIAAAISGHPVILSTFAGSRASGVVLACLSLESRRRWLLHRVICAAASCSARHCE
jgi:hypothetical protein